MAYTSSFWSNIHNYCVAAVMLFLSISMSLSQSSNAAAVSYNVMKFGAQADGTTDSTQAFVKAWASACSSGQGNAVVYIPKGRFLLKAVVFRGPCKNRQVTVQIDGTLVAPTDYRALGNSGYWILFIKVTGLRVLGGSLDARGAAFWACRKSGKSCPVGARSITFNWANKVLVSGLTSINSQATHLVVNSCNNVVIRNVKLIAPSESPNTDGIHVQSSTGVTITGSILQTGDDCIAIGPGTRNLHMSNIKCGPGHGVSIGSLGRNLQEDGVQNVTLTNAVFSGSDNGVRIKSWARPSTGFVRNIIFQNIIMRNVKNPIIIDQNYCPRNQGCPSESSGVTISQVTYRNIQGTSRTAEAVTFDCSPSTPCTGIRLLDIKLTYLNKVATSSCKNIRGTSTGLLMPDPCI
ncbi:polygalacturonase-like [Pyrus x bretschneideri]|uniref:polygalacturonase-like n=1 Tax=Pyrus x bretschneideri TaxID=225117 RepID=UPI000510EDD3|nr:polygalacturonase-like [Pyrus x bretschneideri]